MSCIGCVLWLSTCIYLWPQGSPIIIEPSIHYLPSVRISERRLHATNHIAPGDERGYRPLDCPERDMKEAEEQPVDMGRGTNDDYLTRGSPIAIFVSYSDLPPQSRFPNPKKRFNTTPPPCSLRPPPSPQFPQPSSQRSNVHTIMPYC